MFSFSSSELAIRIFFSAKISESFYMSMLLLRKYESYFSLSPTSGFVMMTAPVRSLRMAWSSPAEAFE